MTSPDYQYEGEELELFAQAVNWKEYLASQMRPFIKGRVLEVGAGLGATTQMLRAISHVSWTCLEPDAKMAATLHERGMANADDAQPINVVVGSLRDIPVEPVFDTILYVDVLEHIADDSDELKEAFRRLSSDGHLVVVSPAHQWLFSPFDEAVGHYRRYRRDTLRVAAPRGLRLVRLDYLDSAGLLASLANRLVLRASQPTVAQIRFWDGWLVPMSRRLDGLLCHRVGKSILGVWQNSEADTP